jgi:fatty acid synthase
VLISVVLVTVQLIPNPKPRSARWVSSSVSQSLWNTPLATHSSAEYHTNNLLSTVLFEEASKHIPANAITIEVAPHGLLQAILHRSLNKATTNIALTQRGHSDCTELLLTALGRCVYCLVIDHYPNEKLIISFVFGMY